MLIWIFMALDILVVATIILIQLEILFPLNLMVFSIVYLLGKGAMFFGEPMSAIDLLIAFYIILMIFGIKITLVYFMIIGWFAYKFIDIK